MYAPGAIWMPTHLQSKRYQTQRPPGPKPPPTGQPQSRVVSRATHKTSGPSKAHHNQGAQWCAANPAQHYCLMIGHASLATVAGDILPDTLPFLPPTHSFTTTHTHAHKVKSPQKHCRWDGDMHGGRPLQAIPDSVHSLCTLHGPQASPHSSMAD